MKDDGPDGVTMIGLHPLVPHEGNIPLSELPALLSRREDRSRHLNVIPFPLEARRLPGAVPVAPLGVDTADGTNVVAFAPLPGKTSGRYRRA
ncbi:hypothetical protein [Rhizobium tubonense]|uniref:Uncharacterized protein n=1 Tax=Rhizobium tubonense TaxID=484088 RepID=A0A2W4EUP6_9HYPH|nr:hypothetical protein [Rhizobium tubonense]PZM13980.1 hypothetical protein CPY51_14105 [Rhizobium tubonense]